MNYSEFVIEHFFNPRNVGIFAKDMPRIYTGYLGAVNVGEVVQIQLQVSQSGLIEDAKFKAYGNPYTIATLSWLTTQLIGLPHEESVQFDYRKIAKEVKLPQSKIHAAVVVADVLDLAIKAYKTSCLEERIDGE